MTSIHELPSEAKCRQIIHKLILGSSLRCPTCCGRLKQTASYLWCRACRHKLRPKARTWLRFSKLSYQQLTLLVWCWQRNIHPGAIRHLTGLSYPTAARWYRRFRRHLPADVAKLSGIVEVDEAFFGRQKYANQRIVVGGIERGSGRVRLEVITDRDQDTLEDFLVRTIAKASYISTDAHAGYSDLEFYGWLHWQSIHDRGEFRETNRIENVWSVAKRQLRRMYGQIRTDRLEEFIHEWEARRNFPKLFENPTAYLQVSLVPY